MLPVFSSLFLSCIHWSYICTIIAVVTLIRTSVTHSPLQLWPLLHKWLTLYYSLVNLFLKICNPFFFELTGLQQVTFYVSTCVSPSVCLQSFLLFSSCGDSYPSGPKGLGSIPAISQFQFKVDRLQIILVAKNIYIYVSQLFISRITGKQYRNIFVKFRCQM